MCCVLEKKEISLNNTKLIKDMYDRAIISVRTHGSVFVIITDPFKTITFCHLCFFFFFPYLLFRGGGVRIIGVEIIRLMEHY